MARREITRRQQRAGEYMRRILGETLLDGGDGLSITVTEVRVSPDLRNATVYFLPLAGGDIEAARRLLERRRGELQRAVSLKYAPRLRFEHDISFDRSDRLRQLMDAPPPGDGE